MIWSFFDPATGEIYPLTVSGPHRETAEANAPEGSVILEGAFDHGRQRVDIQTGQVVPRVPPKPEDDELQTWQWDGDQWVSTPTLVGVVAAVRAERNRRLALTDWSQGVDVPGAVSEPWRPYRQALRDLPEQAGFPLDVDWPVAPE